MSDYGNAIQHLGSAITDMKSVIAEKVGDLAANLDLVNAAMSNGNGDVVESPVSEGTIMVDQTNLSELGKTVEAAVSFQTKGGQRLDKVANQVSQA